LKLIAQVIKNVFLVVFIALNESVLQNLGCLIGSFTLHI